MKELVKDYINNALSETEETTVEQHIMNEGFEFMERRKAWKDLIEPVVDSLENEETPTLRVVSKNRFRPLLRAASLVGLVAIGLWLVYRNTETVSPNAVVATELDVYQYSHNLLADARQNTLLPSETRKGVNETTNQDEADIQAGQYAQIIARLNPIGTERTAEQTYYLAFSYLKINDLAAAKPLFKTVAESALNAHRTDALWLYALIALEQKQTTEAQTALEKVAEKSIAHGKEAAELLQKLK